MSKQKLTIAIISPEYPPLTNWGGIATFNENLSLLLSDMGHEVHVISYDGIGNQLVTKNPKKNLFIHFIPFKTSFKLINFFYYRFPFGLIRNYFNHLFPQTLMILEWNFFAYLGFKKLNKQFQFNIIHSVNYLSPSLLIKIIWPKIPLIIHIQSFQEISEKFYKSTFDLRVQKLLENIFLKRADYFVPCSKKISQSILEKFPEYSSKTTLIHNFIFPNMYGNKTEIDTNNIVFMGRFEYRKGIDIVIKSFIKLAKSNTLLNLYLIGNSDHKIFVANRYVNFMDWYSSFKIPKSVKARIYFFPQMDDKKSLIELLRKIKGIAVVPSRHEPFGFVNIEFMALGYILITSEGEGADEIIEHEHDGFFFKPNNLTHIVLRIKKLDLKDIGNISKYGKDKIINQFSNHSIMNNYVDLYNKLIN